MAEYPLSKQAKREVANLTSLTVYPYLELSLTLLSLTSLPPHFCLHTSLYSCFTALEAFAHILPHLFPFRFSATHPPFAPLSHSSPCHSPFPSFFFSSCDGDWQMIWQRKTSGENKLTSPFRPTSTPFSLSSSSSLFREVKFYIKIFYFSLYSSPYFF